MEPTDKPTTYPFLARGGEMGELTRQYDWSTSPLGMPDQWPSSLRTLLSMMLTSRFPMLMLWGPELTTFYNDAFRPSLGNHGKHPASLGQPGEQSWAESWPVISPTIYDIMAGGEAVWFDDQKLPLYPDSQMGYDYWTYSFSPLTDDSGAVNGVLLTCSETTKAVESIRKVEESEARFRSLIEESPVGTCLYVGPQMRIELANRIILDYWGKGNGVLGKPMLEVMPEVMGQPFPKLLEEVFTTGKTVEQKAARAELRVNGVMGVYYFDFSYKPLFDATGKVYAILDTAIDVTKQVLAHHKLEETEVALRGAIELAKLGTWSIDVATNGLTYSDRMIEWFGYDPAEQPYWNAIPILQTNDQERVSNAIAWALNPESDGVYDEEFTLIHPQTGKRRILRVQGRVVVDETGKAVRMNGTAQDITMQRELQLALESEVRLRTEELAASNEELAAFNEELTASNEEYAVVNTDLEEANSLLTRSNNNLQQFAYVASHDLQEPLRKIQQFGDILKSQYAESLGTGIDYLNRMQLAASRMSTLIQDLLAYSRIASQREVNAKVDLTEVIADVLNDLDLLIQETGAEVTVNQLVTVIGDASQLRLLIQNLLTNALKFRRRHKIPVIAITGQLITADQLPATAKPARWAQAYYCLQVSDNGIGFEEKYLDRIFQVFQRLHGKNEFAGTGIGLAICEKVVANHGGAITATSQPGQGATFSVYLPM